MQPRRATRVALSLTVLIGAGVMAAAVPSTATPPKPATASPVAVGSGGAVVSDTAESTAAGLQVLRSGGTAADAAVAVAATLGVTDPYVAGVGGGGYFVYYDAKIHRVSTIDGRESTPLRADQKLFIDPATGKPRTFPEAVTSGLSVGVPGNLAAWQRALDQWGSRSLAQMLRPAEQVADGGFRVNATLREQTRENAKRFAQFDSSAQLFLPNGRLPAVGSMMRNPDLAATYRQIGREGIRAFYGGPLGRDVVDTVHNLPLAGDATIDPPTGLMQNADLAAYRALSQAPTHVRYRGLDVYGMAPSSSGGTTVGESLNILDTVDLKDMSTVQALHHYLEASRLAFADRNRYIGDARYVDVPKALLSKRFAEQRACLIDPEQAAASPVAPGDPGDTSGSCGQAQASSAREPVEGPNTNHFVVSDKWGDVVSYTNTIEQLGGSAIVVPGHGFLLNNELTDYDFVPLQEGVPDPNLPAPGKRPRSSMSPTIVLKDGTPFLAVGSPGGATIITTVLQVLLNRIDFGMSLPEAIAAPRASQRDSSTTQVEPAFLKLPAAKGLRALGQSFSVVDTSGLDPSIKIAPTIGTAAGLEFRSHGTVMAAGEPTRRGGTVAGVVHPRG